MTNPQESLIYTGTKKFIKRLEELTNAELNFLRGLRYNRISTSVASFDFFSGLWWNLRQNNQWAPKREVSWLISKLYSQYPTKNISKAYFALQLRKSLSERNFERTKYKFDILLRTPFESLEPYLVWALAIMRDYYNNLNYIPLDWIQLTNDLSNWHLESTKIKWTNQFLNINRGV